MRVGARLLRRAIVADYSSSGPLAG